MATELAGGVPISRQAVVKHLSALADAGLLQTRRPRGSLPRHAGPLSDAVSWIADVGA